ncbi:glycosyltransferase [Crenothrix sp.]|uniref:glycosyltransferase n=1 Tax=Crenothrix sp. TaxID=3100433 RepID=UPI00374D07DE
MDDPAAVFSSFKLSKSCQTSVVIPVRNESEHILKTLTAFARQVDRHKNPLDPESFEILMLANNCTDDSVDIIKKFQQENLTLPLYLAEMELSAEDANIGFVRRLLMNAAFHRLRNSPFGDGVMMTTDSDTVVADDWIVSNLTEIKAGADAVGGRIIIDKAELKKMNRLCREIHLKDEEYRLLMAEIETLIDDLPFDHAPRHHQHFNGSFAVTTQAFEQAGGIPEVKFLEDCAFFDRLQKMDAKVRHSPLVKVYTSARQNGRCEVGLSFQINLWKTLRQSGEEILVESAQSIVNRLNVQKELRTLWRRFWDENPIALSAVQKVASQILISDQFILYQLEKKQPFGLFYSEIIQGQGLKPLPLVCLNQALQDLRIAIKKRRG